MLGIWADTFMTAARQDPRDAGPRSCDGPRGAAVVRPGRLAGGAVPGAARRVETASRVPRVGRRRSGPAGLEGAGTPAAPVVARGTGRAGSSG